MTSIPEKHKDFFQSVFEIVRYIPEGRVTNYGAIAKVLSTPRSSRMVGWAMNASHSQKKHVPAHRVVNRNGMLSGKMHFPTPTAMEEALKKEGVEVVEDKIVNFKEVFWDPNLELSL
ncbi:MAG: MGMT family protein [Flavobacteriales bacterium]|jgi:methylated-DNA-protein-cysteine methyltransferase related protein